MKNISILFLALITIALLYSCGNDDDFTTDGNVMLEFSLDTLRFDTVFTDVGSATRYIKVYNRDKKAVRISEIRVAGGDDSFFNINVDGTPGNKINDVEIAGEDSLYIFGEVTVDPNNPVSISPFVIEDDLIFEINGNTQQVLLEAWGQNANYLPFVAGGGTISQLPCPFDWSDPKPYVVYGVLVIDDCTQNIPAGTNIYVHGGIVRDFITNPGSPDSSLIVYNDGLILVGDNGSVNMEGTLENPVVIQGDRLEDEFEESSGQWTGMRLLAGSTGNIMKNVIVKNSIVGVRVDSAASLTISNSQIYNTAGSGLIGVHASITATNCLFYNNGGNAVQCEYGGNYRFDYCTLASYGVDASALRLGNFTCVDPADPLCQLVRINPLNADFQNCIIFGSRRDELSLSDASGGTTLDSFNANFDYCIVRFDELVDNDPFMNFAEQCNECINAMPSDPLFRDANEDNYFLDSLSIAENKAVWLPAITSDLNGRDRIQGEADLGCYEFFPNE